MTKGEWRFSRFSLVGLMGALLQLALLFLLTTCFAVGSILATLIAVEITILHNFIWHERFTWSDRGPRSLRQVTGRLWRFNGGNGLVSLGGNTLLVHYLVDRLKAPVVPTAIGGIMLCSLANFVLADRWVYRNNSDCSTFNRRMRVLEALRDCPRSASWQASLRKQVLRRTVISASENPAITDLLRYRLWKLCIRIRSMSCPFFKPLRILDAGGWIPAPRLPLGSAWAGECTMGGDPPEAAQRELCNQGYARGRCEQFPPDSAADAVRFSLSLDGRLIYILERDHAPVEHGEIDPATDPREPLAAQAKAFRMTAG